jgi:dienelactone hydrolase
VNLIRGRKFNWYNCFISTAYCSEIEESMSSDPFEAFRQSLQSVLGAPPDPAPLEPKVLGTEELETYRREKIQYQVAPGEWSYAYLLIPHNDEGTVRPAVYCHHRHNRDWRLGKSEVVGLAGDPEEAIGLELVKRGYVVFAPDAVAFEERRPTRDDDEEDEGLQRLNDFMNNLRELSVRLLRGETLLKKIISDASRGIDYMETRPEIDNDRIGFMGHGYGSKMAMWVSAFDKRVAASVAHGSIGSMHETLRLEHNIQIEFSVPRLLQITDYDRVIAMSAPRPFLLSASEDDPDSTDARKVFEKAQRAYTRLGVENNLSFYHYPAYDGEPWFTQRARHRSYDWLDGWLKPY